MDAEGNESVAQNADEPFVAGLVTKIATVGGDGGPGRRLLLRDRSTSTTSEVLYVRGGGDPFRSTGVGDIATELVAAVGKKPITGIVLDASDYPSNLRIPGIEDLTWPKCAEFRPGGEFRHRLRRAQRQQGESAESRLRRFTSTPTPSTRTFSPSSARLHVKGLLEGEPSWVGYRRRWRLP